MISWAKLLAGKSFQKHYHQDMEEIFVILSGRAQIRVDQEQTQLGPGDAVLIPKMAHHIMQNLTDTDVEYLVIGISQERGGKTIVV